MVFARKSNHSQDTKAARISVVTRIESVRRGPGTASRRIVRPAWPGVRPYDNSSRDARMRATRAAMNRKSLSLFTNTLTSRSVCPCGRRSMDLSARRHTDRATCNDAHARPPTGTKNDVRRGSDLSISSIHDSNVLTRDASNAVRINLNVLDRLRGVATCDPTSAHADAFVVTRSSEGTKGKHV